MLRQAADGAVQGASEAISSAIGQSWKPWTGSVGSILRSGKPMLGLKTVGTIFNIFQLLWHQIWDDLP